MKKYKLAIIGGTFDRLHVGHKSFIDSSLKISDKLIIGMTSDDYVKNTKKINNAIPFSSRKKDLENYLSEISARNKVEIGKIDKNEIPESNERKIDAIIVTENTLSGAEHLNVLRARKGISPLPIVIVPLVKDKDGDVISSTRIRNGEIDRDGVSRYPKDLASSYSLTPDVRKILKKPMGKVINSDIEIKKHFSNNTVTVGDITTKTLLDLKLHPKIAVIDFMVEREPVFLDVKDLGFTGTEPVYIIEDPASSISKEIFVVLTHVFEKKSDDTTIIKIIGEEDLTVLPILITAPLGANVFYGQPGEGIVHIQVDKKAKIIATDLISRFIRKK